MATPQVKDLVLRSPAGSSDVITFAWPLQIGHGQDKHDNGIDIIDTIKFVCDELPSISSAFDEINLYQIDTACYKTMTNLVDRFNKAVDSIVALEKGTSLPAERLNKFAHPSLLRHILQLVYNAAVLDPDKLNQYEPFSPEVYGETSYELVQQMTKHVTVSTDDTFIDLGSGVGQVVLQMAGSFPLKTCIGIEKADTPARYAERMDVIFRQYMGWFGKRYCEYKLIRGDFLVDEHREKITSSTLVFVNNFAFGPTVDHQLKERFADLRDGARVVSSKSFCPLNFRITDRNLSDIGTIMHVSEIPPLKGSVSWTCKPVSYYLHVIDRTILERYFQRLKTKGGDHEHVGNARTTRDRAKREANIGQHNNNHHHHHNHHHQHHSNNSQRTQSPANVTGGAAGLSAVAASKTRQQAASAQQQHQQQRSLDMESSTESDGEATNGGGNTTTTTTTTSNGPMTRKVWSDWCSSKGKSSQSDDEENNNTNNSNNNSVRNARATTQKKRKKLTRKAAIASKSAAAAAAQREAEREATAANTASANNSKESSSKEDNGGSATNARAGGPGRKGRMKKGARGRKSLKIVGLDVLHKQTVLSTAHDVMTKKLPAAPGTVDQQLTSLLTGDMSHTELDIPVAPQDTPYALQILLDVFRAQYMNMIEHMKGSAYLPQVQKQIAQEQERKLRLRNRASQLDKQIRVLIDDSVALLKVRMNELAINVSSPNDLIAKAKEIVSRHKDLQQAVSKIRNDVTLYENEQKHLLSLHLKHLPEYQKLCGATANGKVKLELPHELSETTAQELVLKEIANTLSQRKKLYAQVSSIEQETDVLQITAEERRTAAALLAQGTNITVATSPAGTMQPLQLTTTATTTTTNNSGVASKMGGGGGGGGGSNAKTGRRSREHRARSQEWPEVPEMGKIEESNPEVLAQKIIETARQIESGKFPVQATTAAAAAAAGAGQTTVHNLGYMNGGKAVAKAINNTNMPAISLYMQPAQDSTLMPAPKQQQQNPQQQQPPHQPPLRLPKCELPGLARKHPINSSGGGGSNAASIQESPKVANFEDRLKSIITSALNEDQEQRSKVVLPPAHSPVQSPAPKRSKHQANANAGPSPSSASQVPNNLHNIITVSTQGLMHLNANTTISPITPPLPGPGGGSAAASTAPTAPAAGLPPHTANGSLGYASVYGGKYGASKTQLSSKYPTMTTTTTLTTLKEQAGKYPGANPAPPPPPPPPSHAGMSHLPPAGLYSGNPADMAYHRRRSSVSATSYEHFMSQQQQQQQQHALMMAAAAHVAQRQQQRDQFHQQHQHQHPAAAHHHQPLEFKAPALAAEQQQQQQQQLMSSAQRSGSREQLDLELLPPRSSSANSDYAAYAPTRERLLTHERSVSRESAVSQPLPLHHQVGLRPPSRPGSNSSQPDYTQVSPAKMALRRHLSQEKLNQHPPQPTPPPPSLAAGLGALPMSSKTIGDLVNGEIERTLEISHQSIINAAVNMSTMGVAERSSSGSSSSGGASLSAAPSNGGNPHFMERSFLAAERERLRSERLLINLNAQRPERVHVRPLAEEPQPTNYSQAATVGKTPPPYQNNLATLEHVAAYGQKANAKQQQHPNNSSSLSRSGSSRGEEPPYQPRPRPSNARDYQPVALPRAEMKGCIEAYFHEEQQQQQQQQKSKAGGSGGGAGLRAPRLNGANPPLEGLAASLQDHVRARKYKEENEERQRRAAAVAAAAAAVVLQTPTDLAHYAPPPPAPQQQLPPHALPAHHYHLANVSAPNLNGTPHKVELGMKRSSPLASHQQPRPSKMPLYEPSPHLHQPPGNPYATSNGGLPPPPPNAHHGTPLALHAASPSPTPSSCSSSGGRRSNNKLLVEPLLMSPEINSIMGDERPLQLSRPHSNSSHHGPPALLHQQQTLQQQQQPAAHQSHLQRVPQHSNSNTPTIVGARANAADDGKPNVDQASINAQQNIAPPPTPPPAAHVTYRHHHQQQQQQQHNHNYPTRLACASTQLEAQDLTKKAPTEPELSSFWAYAHSDTDSDSNSDSDSDTGSVTSSSPSSSESSTSLHHSRT